MTAQIAMLGLGHALMDTGKGRFFLHIYVSSSSIMLWFFANFLDDPIIASHNIICIYRLFAKPCVFDRSFSSA